MREEKRTKKIYMLECNPRFWGSIAASYMTGVDFSGLGIQTTLEKSTVNTIPEHTKDYYVLSKCYSSSYSTNEVELHIYSHNEECF